MTVIRVIVKRNRVSNHESFSSQHKSSLSLKGLQAPGYGKRVDVDKAEDTF